MDENYQPIEIMHKLFNKDYENKVCVECKAPMPSFVSINNAILLCNQCAERHMKLGYNVSYIRHISSDWDPYLFSFLERGGNSRFIRLSKKYELDNMPIEQKFNTRILEYYRLLVSYNLFIFFEIQIKSEVLADIPPFEVPYEYAKEPINNQAIYFPEFENYQIFVGRYKPEKKDPGLIDAFRYVGSGLGSMANYLGDKYQEYDMNNKIIDGGAATLKGLGIAGKSLYKIAKPVAKYATIRTVQGVGYLCDQIKNLLMEKDVEEKVGKEDGEDNNMNKDNKKNEKNKGENTEKNINQKNEVNNNLYPQEEQFIFEPCVDYPTFESINRLDNNYNNDNYNNNPNNINNNINNNNINENLDLNNFQNQKNISINSTDQAPPANNNYNNQINKFDYVIPPELSASANDNSIVEEK